MAVVFFLIVWFVTSGGKDTVQPKKKSTPAPSKPYSGKPAEIKGAKHVKRIEGEDLKQEGIKYQEGKR